MAETEAKMFDLVDALEALCEEGIPVFPGRSIVDAKRLYSIVKAFPNAISNEIKKSSAFLIFITLKILYLFYLFSNTANFCKSVVYT